MADLIETVRAALQFVFNEEEKFFNINGRMLDGTSRIRMLQSQLGVTLPVGIPERLPSTLGLEAILEIDYGEPRPATESEECSDTSPAWPW